MKRCTKCGVEKPSDSFCLRGDHSGRLRSSCKNCDRAQSKAWRRAHPDQAQAYNKQWRKDNPDKVRVAKKRQYETNPEKERARVRRHHAAHPEQGRKRAKEWAEANRERRDENVRRWRQANAERVRARKRQYYAAHPKRAREAVRRWSAAHPDVVRAYAENRRARKMKAKGTYTAADIRKLYELQKGKCWWCGKKLKAKKFHADHRIPLSKGGSNDISNIVLAHAKCNLSKGAKMPSEAFGRLL